MTHSRRHTPGRIYTDGQGQPYKRLAHRRERVAVRVALGTGQPLPHPRRYGSRWYVPGDSKRKIDPALWPEWTRK